MALALIVSDLKLKFGHRFPVFGLISSPEDSGRAIEMATVVDCLKHTSI